MSIERSFPLCKRKKLSKKSWWMLSRYRVIQILRPVFSYPPYHWYAFQDFTSCFEEETGSSRFEHGTRPARPSQRIINSKSDIRTHFTLAVSSRSLALSRYICILHFVITSERRKEEGRRRRRRRSKKNSKKKKEEDPCSFLRWLWIYSWIEERFTLHVGTHYSYGSEKTNANVVMLRHVKGEDLDVR